MGCKSVKWGKLPEVCKGCRFLDADSVDEYSPYYHYCQKGFFLPTKNNQCRAKENKKSQAAKGGE